MIFEVGKEYIHKHDKLLYKCVYSGLQYVIFLRNNEEIMMSLYSIEIRDYVENIVTCSMRHVFRIIDTGEIVTSRNNTCLSNYKRIGYLNIKYNPALDDTTIEFVKEN